MQIDKNLIKKVAGLARLELTEHEIEEFTPQLKEILEAFSKLDEVNTDDTESSFHPVKLKNSIRGDIVGECLTQDEALKNTEHKKDGYFKGPRAV